MDYRTNKFKRIFIKNSVSVECNIVKSSTIKSMDNFLSGSTGNVGILEVNFNQ